MCRGCEPDTSFDVEWARESPAETKRFRSGVGRAGDATVITAEGIVQTEFQDRTC